jgi:hypothetical protein
LTRGLRKFLGFEAGVAPTAPEPQGRSALKEPAAPEQTEPLVGELARLRRRLAATEAELSEARTKLAGQGTSGKGTPTFFVVGEPKSGTGWLEKILDSHPEVLCRSRGVFFGRELRREEQKEAGARMPPSSLHNAILEDEYLRLWIERSGWTKGEDPEDHLAKLTRLAIDYFLTERLSKTGKRLVGDKTPFFVPDVLSEMSVIYPEAKVIHIIRDGRDVAVSRMHHLWKAEKRGAPSSLEPEELAQRDTFYRDPQGFLDSGRGIFSEGRLRSIAEDWRANVGKAIENGPALFGSNYVEVSYEDLLERPEREAARLFAFLGADASGAVVGRCVEEASFEKGAGRKRGQENYAPKHGKYRKGIAGDWKNVFTKQDRAAFKEVAGELLTKLGYEKDNTW